MILIIEEPIHPLGSPSWPCVTQNNTLIILTEHMVTIQILLEVMITCAPSNGNRNYSCRRLVASPGSVFHQGPAAPDLLIKMANSIAILEGNMPLCPYRSFRKFTGKRFEFFARHHARLDEARGVLGSVVNLEIRSGRVVAKPLGRMSAEQHGVRDISSFRQQDGCPCGMAGDQFTGLGESFRTNQVDLVEDDEVGLPELRDD